MPVGAPIKSHEDILSLQTKSHVYTLTQSPRCLSSVSVSVSVEPMQLLILVVHMLQSTSIHQ